jgi:hypothetical protein
MRAFFKSQLPPLKQTSTIGIHSRTFEVYQVAITLSNNILKSLVASLVWKCGMRKHLKPWRERRKRRASRRPRHQPRRFFQNYAMSLCMTHLYEVLRRRTIDSTTASSWEKSEIGENRCRSGTAIVVLPPRWRVCDVTKVRAIWVVKVGGPPP